MKRSIAMLISVVVALSIGLASVAGCARAPAGEKPEAFFQGKTMSLITGSVASSGDGFSRALAPFLAKETGATVIVENNPGGGTTQAINLAFKAKPDGLTILVYETLSVMLADWLEQRGAEWKVAEFNWLARLGSQPAIFAASPQKPYKSIQDLQQAKGLKFGASSAQGFYATNGALASWVLNLDATVIIGFAGTAPLLLAVQKGELDGNFFSEDLVDAGTKAGQMRPLFSLYGKSELLPNLPALNDVVKLTDQQKMMLESLGRSDKGIAVAPGVPKDRVDFLAKVVDKIGKDKAAQQEILKKTGIAGWYGSVSRADVQKYMSDPKISSEAKQLLRTLFARYHK